MNVNLVEIKDSDFPFIKEIYDWYVLHSTATFHTEPVTIDDLRKIIPVAHRKYKSFIIFHEGIPCGYCYISQYKPRQAYDRTAEVTVYLHHSYRGRGVGQKTIELLEAIARENKICVLLGIITGENHQSIHAFEKSGFEKCAHYKKVGEKFNRLLDVVSYEKIIEPK